MLRFETRERIKGFASPRRKTGFVATGQDGQIECISVVINDSVRVVQCVQQELERGSALRSRVVVKREQHSLSKAVTELRKRVADVKAAMEMLDEEVSKFKTVVDSSTKKKDKKQRTE